MKRAPTAIVRRGSSLGYGVDAQGSAHRGQFGPFFVAVASPDDGGFWVCPRGSQLLGN